MLLLGYNEFPHGRSREASTEYRNALQSAQKWSSLLLFAFLNNVTDTELMARTVSKPVSKVVALEDEPESDGFEGNQALRPV